MSDYKRLFSYLYFYQHKIKEKNSGFVKVEIRNNQCRLQLSVKGGFLNQAPRWDVYGFTREGHGLRLWRLGQMNAGNGQGEWGAQMPFARFLGEAADLNHVAGLLVYGSRSKEDQEQLPDMEDGGKGLVCATVWDDLPLFRPGEASREMLHAAQVDEPEEEKGRYTEAEAGPEEALYTKEALHTEEVLHTEEILHTEEALHTEETLHTEKALHEEGVLQSEREEIQSDEEEPLQAEETGVVCDTREEWDTLRELLEEKEVERIMADRAALPESSEYMEWESKQRISEGESKQRALEREPKQRALEKELKQRTSVDELKQRTSEEEPKQRTSEDESKQRTSEGELKQRTIEGEPKQRMSEGEPKRRVSEGEPKSRTSEGEPKRRAPEGEPNRQASEQETDAPGLFGPPKPSLTPAEPTQSERQAGTRPVWEQEPGCPCPEQCIWSDMYQAPPKSLWEKLASFYPKLILNGMGSDWEILKIMPRDIGRLPRETWVYGNNSFLLHGYYRHHHLILACYKGTTPHQYYLGVPGSCSDRERVMASMFGFANYLPGGKRGYWYTPINLGNN